MRWGTTPLEVAQNDQTRFESGLPFDRVGDDSTDAAEPKVTERIRMRIHNQRALVGELRTFGDDHDAVFLTGGPPSG